MDFIHKRASQVLFTYRKEVNKYRITYFAGGYNVRYSSGDGPDSVFTDYRYDSEQTAHDMRAVMAMSTALKLCRL